MLIHLLNRVSSLIKKHYRIIDTAFQILFIVCIILIVILWIINNIWITDIIIFCRWYYDRERVVSRGIKMARAH